MRECYAWLCRRCLLFAVQQRLTSPDLLHSEKLQEWIKRNSLNQEKHPELDWVGGVSGDMDKGAGRNGERRGDG